ncbi:glucosaminidase domain-containing protein [Rhizobium sp. RHZ01]|uniref:glucosaminidase domain-containing protein n=1 Tax=Rhizobium sp. RHZ01 TaxID=2769304 RepID=UPI00177AF20B|nr:glucosaminidase domain-containing protein [Rhizobium sp. RHZ01]MBD9449730.1 glucosaminidase domain-containing protein [Rhizobium sp. RHZ01]
MSSDGARLADLQVLHPVVRDAVDRVIAQLRVEEIPFEVFEAYRTPERQRMLYAQGRTAPGDIVTKARPWSSYHQYGLAVDFVLRIDGNWSWSSKGKFNKWWERLHAIGRANNLEPLSWELPHLQYSGTSIEKLLRGEYPPLGDEAWAENVAATIAGWSGVETAPPPPPDSVRRPGISLGAIVDDTDEETFGRTEAATDDVINEIPEIGLVSAVITAAQASDRIWGVPASVTLAQFVLESAGGKRMPPGSNNPFGIKAKEGEPYVLARTGEVLNGKRVTVTARFRKFANFDEAFSQHGRLLGTSSYYRKAMAVKDDPLAFCNALTGVYATDPNYGKKLIRLINQHELIAYDKEPAVVTVPLDAGWTATGGTSMILQFGGSGEAVRGLQQMLKEAGYSVGAVDGVYGTLTRAAVGAFQLDNGLTVTGIADSATMIALNSAPSRPLGRSRLNATEADLVKEGSATVIDARRTKMLGWISGIFGVLGIGNSTAVTAGGGATTPAPGFGGVLAQLQTYLANPTAPNSIALLDEIRKGTPIISDVLKSIDAGSLPDLSKLQALIASQPVTGTTARTVFDFLTNRLAGSSGLEPVAQVIGSVAASLIPGFGGSVVALGIGLFAHYFGSKIAQNRVQEHREGSNLNR